MFSFSIIASSFLVYVIATWHYFLKYSKSPFRFVKALFAGFFSGQILIRLFTHETIKIVEGGILPFSPITGFFLLSLVAMIMIPLVVLLYQKIYGIHTYVEALVVLCSLTTVGSFVDAIGGDDVIIVNAAMLIFSGLCYFYKHKDFEQLIINLGNSNNVNTMSVSIWMYVLTVATLIYNSGSFIYISAFKPELMDRVLIVVHVCAVAGICAYFFSVKQLIRGVNTTVENEQLNRAIHDADKMLLEGKQKMLDSQESVIAAFAEILENKSGESGGHVKRVALYSEILARKLGLPDDEVHIIKIASMMHDVGKILVPNEILEKKGRFTYEEREAMKLHVAYGDKILSNAQGEIMFAARNIAKEHHERWDGKGYLYGLSKNEISLEAQIVSVADVFDALTSKRCYKDAWDIESSYKEIVDGSGTQFSPDVVEAFKQGFEEFKIVMRDNPEAADNDTVLLSVLRNNKAS